MSHRPIHEWFAAAAAQWPGTIAIDCVTDAITYADLDARANRLANALRARGIPRHARVMILADDLVAIVAAIVGVLRAGAMFVPLDPRTPERRLQAMIAEIEASWFVADTRFAPLVASAAAAAGSTATIVDADECRTGSPALGAPAVWAPDDPCYVYFTSGSTGQPKGIVGRLKGIDHFVRWEIATLKLTPGVRVSQLISPSFDAFMRDIFTPLCAGGTVCAPESPDVRLDAVALARWLDDARVNLVHCVPSLLRTILAQQLPSGSLAALRQVLTSGEPLLPIDIKRWSDLFGDRVQLVNLYGPSETTMTKFFYVVQPLQDQHRSTIPIGVPMEGAAAIVMDDAGQPCAKGAVGEIYIRTPYRSLGYYGRDELTRAVFVPNPFSKRPDDLIYRTGDLARVLEDGNFELRGRRDHQVKIRGERVELGAVENALRRHPEVRDVAVIDREDASGTKFLCAYVAAGDGVRAGDLKEALARELPASMVPTAWVMLDSLPRTDSGKMDRHRLPPPASEARAMEVPETPLQAQMAGLFAEVLSVPMVGINESFFELGGHSLLATQLISRVRAFSGIDLPVRAIFDAPTVAGLARYVEALKWAAQGAGGTAVSAAEVQEVEL